jgi:polyhydroxyalkanoate synthase subunit PhaC
MKGLPNLLTLWKRPKPAVGVTPADVVFQENKWKLLRYVPRAAGLAHKTPLLLIPSLINKHYVLDLMPGKSFAEWFVAQGHDVWCIDWGTPGAEDRYVTFDDVVDGIIGRALSQVSKRAGVTKSHVLGYCMGGTLAAAHAALHPERFQSFIALAAPVKFDDGGLLSQWTRMPSFDVDGMVDAFGLVPWQLMQSAFHMLRPTLGLSKAMMLLDRAWNDEFLDGYLALETWGNDNVSMPGDFYRTYVKDLYRGDALVNGTLRMRGKPAKLSSIECPTLCVSFEQDNIVPRASSAALVEHIGSRDKQELHLQGGHVGAVVSKHAAKTLWPQLSQWLAAHELPAQPATAPRKTKAGETSARS